jgi:hypothetical protein
MVSTVLLGNNKNKKRFVETTKKDLFMMTVSSSNWNGLEMSARGEHINGFQGL